MTCVYFDEVPDSRKNKALRSSTFYKVTRPFSLDEILNTVTRNAAPLHNQNVEKSIFGS